ncbi:transcriptional activator [Streptococcus pneumoniae]|nr:transcriptional activator [Streptococcus pneumoniae]
MLIGQKIKEIRIEKGISRPDFCGDEQELTVRQLSRIESGASQPSLPKLDYIARRLGVPVYSLMPDFSAFYVNQSMVKKRSMIRKKRVWKRFIKHTLIIFLKKNN